MTLQGCYAAIGGDYEEAFARLRSDRLVEKFVLKFLDDGSYGLLCRAWEEKDYGEAFRAAHTIKGICQNLSFVRLLDSSSRLSDALRSGWTPEAETLIEQVKEDYIMTTDVIRALREEKADEADAK